MPAYFEFNFSLSGEWSAYSFIRYRERARAQATWLPAIRTDVSENRAQLAARLPLEGAFAVDELEVGLSAVLERKDGDLTYWALRHPPGKPDFHHDDAFALKLDALRH